MLPLRLFAVASPLCRAVASPLRKWHRLALFARRVTSPHHESPLCKSKHHIVSLQVESHRLLASCLALASRQVALPLRKKVVSRRLFAVALPLCTLFGGSSRLL